MALPKGFSEIGTPQIEAPQTEQTFSYELPSGFGEIGSFQPKIESPPELDTGTTPEDYGRSLAVGLGRFGQTIGRAVDVAGNVDPTGLLDKAGQKIESFYKEKVEEDIAAMSPAMKEAQKLRYTTDVEESWKEAPLKNIKSLFQGEAWKSPAKVTSSLLQSAPSTIVGMGTGIGITAGLIKKGVSAGLAGVVGGFIGEGGTASVESGKDVYDLVVNAPIEVISKTPEFQKAMEALSDEPLTDEERERQVRELVADHAAMKSMAKVFAATGLLGSFSGHYMGKLLGGETTGGIARKALTEGGLETLQEAPQSGYEVLEQNLQKKKFVDPNQDIWQGVKEASVEGGVQGFVMGAGLGGGVAAMSQEQADTAATTNLKVNGFVASDDSAAGVDIIGGFGFVNESLEKVIETLSNAPMDTLTGQLTDDVLASEHFQNIIGELTQAGIAPEDMKRAIVERVVPTMTSSLQLGLALKDMTTVQKRQLLSDMNNVQDPKLRAKAIEQIEKGIEDPKLAQSWANSAIDQVNAGERINFDQSLIEFASQDEASLEVIRAATAETANINYKNDLQRKLDNLKAHKNPTDKVKTNIITIERQLGQIEQEEAIRAEVGPQVALAQKKANLHNSVKNKLQGNQPLTEEEEAYKKEYLQAQVEARKVRDQRDKERDEFLAYEDYSPQLPGSEADTRKRAQQFKNLQSKDKAKRQEALLNLVSLEENRLGRPSTPEEIATLFAQAEPTPAMREAEKVAADRERIVQKRADTIAAFTEKQQEIDDSLEAGRITDQEAADFTAKVKEERRIWDVKNKKAGSRKLQEELTKQFTQAEEILPENIPDEFIKQAKKDAEKVVRENPTYQQMAEMKQRGGLNLYNAQDMFSKDTINILNKKHPGLFQGGHLAATGQVTNVDEAAQEFGYSSADEMVNTWLKTPSIKSETARLVNEQRDEWERAETLQKKTEEKLPEREIGIPQEKVISPEGKINGITINEATRMMAEGNRAVIEDIRQGIAEHGVKPVEDAILNGIQKEILAAPSKEARKAVRANIIPIEKEIKKLFTEPALKAAVPPIARPEVAPSDKIVTPIKKAKPTKPAAKPKPKAKPKFTISNKSIPKEVINNETGRAFIIEDLVASIYKSGMKLSPFIKGMKSALGKAYSKVRKYVQQIFKDIVAFNERLGEVGAPEKSAIEVNEKKPTIETKLDQKTEASVNVIQELTTDLGRAAVNRMQRRGALKIVETQDEAKRIIAEMEKPDVLYSKDGKIAGFTDGKTAHLVSDGIQQGKAGDVLNHELGVHVRQLLLSDKAYRALEKSMDSRKDEDSVTGKAIRDAMARVPDTTKPEHRLSETLAYMVEDSPKIGIVRQFIARVKKFLIDILGAAHVNKLTRDDLKALAVTAVRREGVAAAPLGTGVNEFAQSTKMSLTKVKNIINNLPAFKKWFTGSKVVDENGEPLVVYHGTTESAIDEFFGGGGVFGDGIYFSPDPSFAGEFGDNVYPVYLKMENPYKDTPLTEAEAVKVNGLIDPIYRNYKDFKSGESILDQIYDTAHLGFIAKELGYDGLMLEGDGEYIVFEPTQIKSIFNQKWDPASPDIMKSVAAKPSPLTEPANKEQEMVDQYRKLEDLIKNPDTPISEKRAKITKFSKDLPSDVRVRVEAPLAYISRFLPLGVKAKRMVDTFSQIENELTPKKATPRKSTATPGSSARKYTPEQQDYIDTGGFGVRPKKTIKQRVDETKVLATDKLRQGVVDQFHSLRSILKDDTAWMMSHLTKSDTGVLMTAINQGMPVWEESGAIDVKPGSKSLKEILAPLGENTDRFLAWVAANRAERLSAEDRENLFTDNQIAAGKTLNEGFEDLFNTARDEFEELGAGVTDIAVKTGLVSAAEAQQWKDEGFYVPFYRMLEEQTTGTRGPSNIQALTNQKAYKKLKGGKSQLEDLLTNTLSNWNHLISAGLRNQAGKKALETAETMGLAIQVPKELKSKNAIYVRDDGKEVWYELDASPEGQLVLDSLMSLNYEGMNNVAMKGLRMFKRALTTGVTASPGFMIRNLIRDSLHAPAVSTASKNPLKNIAVGIKDRATMKRMEAGGGAFSQEGYIYGSDPDAMKRLVGVSRETILNTPGKVKRLWRRYENFGNMLENINRVASFQKDIAAGKTLLEANFNSRDQMDFARSGSFPAVRMLAQTVPFFNARLQGLDKLGRSVMDKDQRRQFAQMVGMYSLASVALMLAMKDDEDYEEAEEWEKRTYHMFKIPGSDQMYRIPRPFEVGAIAFLTEQMTKTFLDENEDIKGLGSALSHTLTDTLAMNPIPQAFKPLVELYSNKSMFTGRDIETAAMKRLSKKERFQPWTSQTAQGFSAGMSALLPESVTLSPVQTQHLVRAYTGWAGSQVLASTDFIIKKMTGQIDPEVKISEYKWNPIESLSREKGGRSTKYVTRFYENMDILNREWADIRRYRETDPGKKVSKAVAKRTRLRKRYNRISRRLSELRKKEKHIFTSKTMTATAKRESIARIRRQKNNLTKNMVVLTRDYF